MESAVLDLARKTSKKCQIEGCHEITVGSRTALCRKHRNNKYKQNYNKKKKRKAHSPDEMPSDSIENQLAEEKCLMEQKYASMLQQVLAQKRLELLQSENVIQVLRAHQQKVKQDKIKEIQERKLKKEQEPTESTDQGSVPSKMASDASSKSIKDGNSNKSNFRATKTAKKPQHSKKSPAKAVALKNVQIGNNLTFSGNMGLIPKPLLPSSDLATKRLYAGVSIAPSAWTNSDCYVGQNLLAPKVPAQQAAPMRSLTMSTQHVPIKIDSVCSYQQNTLSGVSQSGGYANICIESVKDLSLGPSGKVATTVITSPSLNSKTAQNVHARLLQNVPPYQMIKKGSLPRGNITSQEDRTRQSFQSLTASCTSALATTGGNLVTAMAVAQQSEITMALSNYSQAMSLSNGHITTSGTFTQVSQTNQGDMSQNWPNQMIPETATGRLQTPGIHDDFLLQMLQDSKDSQVELVPHSQANNTMTSLDHVMTDQTWTLSVGM